jgi:hypothetical protein
MQEQNEPGAVIAPAPDPTPPTPPLPQMPTAQPASPTPQPVVSASIPSPFEPTQPRVSSDNTEPFARAEVPTGNGYYDAAATEEDGLFMTWQTQQTNDNSKAASWYAAVVVVALALTGIVFFLTEQDILVSLAVFLAVLGFAYLAGQEPKEQQYALSQEGIYVGNKLRLYKEFKNFSQVEDVSGPTIFLVTHKRISSPLVLRLNRDNVDEAVNTLSQFLPIQERKPDVIDHLMRRMRL